MSPRETEPIRSNGTATPKNITPKKIKVEPVSPGIVDLPKTPK